MFLKQDKMKHSLIAAKDQNVKATIEEYNLQHWANIVFVNGGRDLREELMQSIGIHI